jgi:hypothetical protein
MPNYNPQDMALILRMSKKGAMSPAEMELMQGVNAAMQPEIAAGNVRMAPMPTVQGTGGSVAMPTVDGSSMAVPMPQSQPMNRLAQIQAAANQVMAGQENPEGQRMANIAKYFQGRK